MFIILILLVLTVWAIVRAIQDFDKKTVYTVDTPTSTPNFDKKTVYTVDTPTSTPKIEISMPDIPIANRPVLYAFSDDTNFNDDYTAYFKNGALYDVSPRNHDISLDDDRQTAYSARYIISDGIKYDLKSIESIKSIVVPNFKKGQGATYTTHDMSYILKMKALATYEPNIAVPFVYKVAGLMRSSSIGWDIKDYFKLVSHLWEIGQFEYGDALLKILGIKVSDLLNNTEIMRKKFLKNHLNMCKEFNTDYILAEHLFGVCEKCAKYQDRVYSISGKDKRFPPLSAAIAEHIDTCCGISFFSFFLFDNNCTISIYKKDADGNFVDKEVNAIEYSNRPYVDDRSEEEKEAYNRICVERKNAKEKDESIYKRENCIARYYDRLEFQKIKEIIGDGSPKNYSGYRRMKLSNSKGYQKITQIAEVNNVLAEIEALKG